MDSFKDVARLTQLYQLNSINMTKTPVYPGVINPKEILERNIIQIPEDVDIDKILQPNGIDLYLSSVSEIDQIGASTEVGDNVKTLHRLGRPLPTTKGRLEDEYFLLEKNRAYRVETEYNLKLPEDVAACIFVRSTLNRNGVLLGSGLWDSGYDGMIGSTLYPQVNCRLYPPCRFAQIVFFRAESSRLYDGTYNIKKKTNKGRV